MTEVFFIVEEDSQGFIAKGVGVDVVAKGLTRQQLADNVRTALLSRFGETAEQPKLAHLHYVHDETIFLTNAVRSGENDVVEQLRGSVLRDDDPFGPPAPIEDWEALN